MLLWLAGCNQAFDLAGTELIPSTDAPVAPDVDQDGVPDSEDNCPSAANPLQGDEDADTLGDVCDNCPLIANADQRNDGDSDAIGDLCDPRPVQAGDCLILLDTFTGADASMAHWLARPTTPASNVSATTEGLLFDPPSQRATLVPLGDDGQPIRGLFDVVLVGMANEKPGSILGAAATTDPAYNELFSCQLHDGDEVRLDMPTKYVLTDLSVDPIAPNIAMRISLRDPAASPLTASCRIDYGIAVGTVNSYDQPPAAGEPGIIAQGDPVTITGFALYQRRTTCPTPIMR
jgi:hypothetical protein